MKQINGADLIKDTTSEDLKMHLNEKITINACVHKIKNSGTFSFVYLRTGRYVFQGVYSEKNCAQPLEELCTGAYVCITGNVHEEKRADYGYEIEITSFEIISKPVCEYPLPIDEKLCNFSLEDNLEHRNTALRHPNERAVFKISEGVVQGFTSFMLSEHFTQISTPILTMQTSEADTSTIKAKYFNNECILRQSPQLYKQSCAVFFERVFEVGKSYSGKRRNSTRHLNEYTTLDFEMAFTKDLYDVMNMLTASVRAVIDNLSKNYQNELNILNIALPEIDSVMSVSFFEAMEILSKDTTQADLDPMDELKLCEYAKEKWGSDFIFVTHFPEDKQPFYIKNRGDFTTESFVLLYKGAEISGGGLRIYSYDEQVEKMKRFSIDCDAYADFLSLHKYGMPPMGGAGMGLERFVMKLLNLENIRYASLFPRDIHTVLP